jgi:multidrug efflux pump subunit AcrB
LALVGLLFLPYISVNLNPDHSYPSFTVETNYANASPYQIETKITRPLEAAISTMPGVKRLYSVSKQSNSRVTIDLQDHVDLDFFRLEMVAKIRQIYEQFPKEASFPSISMNKPNEENSYEQILSYSLFAPQDREIIYRFANDQLAPSLSSIKGIYKIDVTGGARKEYQLYYDKMALTQFKISTSQIEEGIRDHFKGMNLGLMEYSGQTYHVSIDPSEMATLLDIPISLSDNQIVPLKDVISVKEVDETVQSLFRINGQNNIRISFIPTADANHLVLAKEIKEALARTTLPQSFTLIKEYDTTEFISGELNKIKNRTFWSLGILLLFVVVTYRTWKHLAIIAAALLVNLGIGTLFYYLLSVQLNLYAIAAITVSFGMIIDNSIIMIHHYGIHRNKAIFAAIITATLTTLSALIVIYFLPDVWQWNLMDFGKVLAINLSVSMLVAYLFVPAAMDLLKYEISNKQGELSAFVAFLDRSYTKWIVVSARYRKLIFTGLILLFGTPIFLLPNQWIDHEWYNKSLGNDWYLEEVKPYVNKAFGGTIRLFLDYVYERASYRNSEETKLFVKASLPLGATIEQMDDLMRKIEGYLSQFDDKIKTYTTNINGSQIARIEITFRNGVDESFPFILENRLKKQAVDLGEVQWSIYGIGKGFSNGKNEGFANFTLQFKGYNKEVLDQLLEDFSAKLEEHPRVETVERNANIVYGEKKQQQYFMELDKRIMVEKQVTLNQLISSIEGYNSRPNTIAYTKDNKAIKLVETNNKQNDIWHLQNEYQYAGTQVFNTNNFIDISLKYAQNSIHKENQQYIRRISWDYIGTEKFGKEHLDKTMADFSPKVPLGYEILQRKYNNWNGESQKQYALLLMIIAIIFVICAIHFESFVRAFNIICIIPISFIGIFLTFYLFDLPFDQGGYTSFLLTSGLVVNSVVLMLTDFQQKSKTQVHLTSIECYKMAFDTNMTPIFLTTISSILGMVPFLMDGQDEIFWYSLAAGTIGGLFFSLLFIILFLPAFVLKMEKK